MQASVDISAAPVGAPPELAELPLGELARTYPQALGLLRALRLDYCCGGARSLREAATERGLDVQEVQQRIAALQPQPQPAEQHPLELIARIIERYHDTHRAELPELVRLAHKVERVHAAHAQVPAGLERLLQQCLDELSDHMAKEEQVLFPLMRQAYGHAADLRPPIARMRAEHEEHGHLLLALRTLTHDFQPPADACNSWRALFAGVAKFCDDLMQHIHLENNVLFVAFEPARAA